jgi:hypothetical protein
MTAPDGPGTLTALPPTLPRLRALLTELLARRTIVAWLNIGLVIAAGSVIRFGQLFHSLNEQYAFRQTQTAFAAREFAEHGIDLSTSPLPVFGAPWSIPMEFPLFQAIASLLVSAGIDADVASRVVSLVFFQLTGILLAVLLLRWTSRLTTIVAIVCFEFTPFGIEWGAASLIEFLATFLILAMIIGVDLWFRKGSITGLVLASVTAPLAFAVKITTAVPWCVILLGLAIVLLRDHGWRTSWRRILVGYLVGPGLGLAAGVLWTRYSDAIKTENPFTGFLTSSSLVSWNFGTLGDRVSPSLHYIAFRVMDLMAGPLALTLVAAVVAIALTKRARVELLSLVAVPFAAVAIFTNLYIQHEYYLAAVFPAIAALVGVGIVGISKQLARRWMPRVALASILTAVILALSWVSPLGQSYATLFARSAAAPAASIDIRQNTAAGAQVLMIGCSWDPTILYYAHRRGLTLRGAFSSGYNVSGYEYAYSCTPDLAIDEYLPAAIKTELIAPDLYRISQ